MYSTYGTYNYNNGITDGGIFAVLMAFIGVVVVISLAVAIFMIIAQWKIFEKGKKPGWASLIPIYNQYIMCKMVGVNPWWILIVFVCGLLNVIPIIGSLISIAASIYFVVLLNVSLARAFNKEDNFAIGLILLPIVFMPILAFSKAEYAGENPMNDVVFKKAQEVVDNNTDTKADANSKFCSSCGKKMNKNAKFCTSCGKEVK